VTAPSGTGHGHASFSPIMASALTSQKEQIVKVPSSPLKPVSVPSQDKAVLGQLVGDGKHSHLDAVVGGRKESHNRRRQQRGGETRASIATNVRHIGGASVSSQPVYPSGVLAGSAEPSRAPSGGPVEERPADPAWLL